MESTLPPTKLVLGLDEAGYGPNLGPLCFGASLWRVPAKVDMMSLAEQLIPTFQAKASEKIPMSWIPLGDSKKLYKSGSPLTSLSVGLLTLLQELNQPVELKLESLLHPLDQKRIRALPWYAPPAELEEAVRSQFDPNLDRQLLPGLRETGTGVLRNQLIELLGIRSRAMDESTYNEKLIKLGNKSTLLSLETLGWVAEWIQQIRGEYPDTNSIDIYCDKHGGRNKYLAPLLQVFPDGWFEVECESAESSRYRGKIDGLETHWSFTAKGDSLVPSSVASMAAKWTREILMHRLNSFWKGHLPELQPTAGYPVDAKRFASAIEEKSAALGLNRDQWWRRA